MKKLLIPFLLVLPAEAALAQLNIDWFKIPGGGGTSTGSLFAVTGTVGQSDTGQMTGGQFSLVGGFWGFVASAPTLGAPALSITATATNTILIGWPSPSAGFALQENADLGTAHWVNSVQTPADDGTMKWVIIAPQGHNVFYRLTK